MSGLTLGTAVALAAEAAAAAAEEGVALGVVIMDAGGNVLLAQRHEDAYLTVLQIAERKAFTAVNFRSPTHVMMERLGTLEYAVHIAQADGRLAFIKGGVPLYAEGRLIGAIAASGGSGDQDLSCVLRAAEVVGLQTTPG
jgi:glc operon protein GlcG